MYRPDTAPSIPMALAVQACATTCPQVDHLLGPDGPLVRPGWQDRPQQRALANTVRRALKQQRHALTEGGTGVGKSFALLVPAILHAMETRSMVLVSTKTLNLQDQYRDKDLPALETALGPYLIAKFGRSFTWGVQKGKGNYLCEAKREAPPLDLAVEAEMVATWRESTQDGDLTRLPFDVNQPRYRQLRKTLVVERDDCPGKRCHSYDQCWYYSAREQAKAADILVVNHALLMQALAREAGTVLPPWGACVVDEAHTLEEEARSALGIEFTAGRVRTLAAKCFAFLASQHGRQGAIHDVVDATEEPVEVASAEPDVDGTEFEVASAHIPTPEGIEAEVGGFWRALEDEVRPRTRDGQALLQLPQDLEHTAAGDHLRELLEMLRRLSLEVEMAGGMHWEQSEDRAKSDALVQGVSDLCREYQSLRNLTADKIAWLHLGAEKRPPSIHAVPVDVSQFLRDSLWKFPTALSSATLATGVGEKAFAYVQESLGVQTLHQIQVSSPFAWDRQAWLYLPEEGMAESLLATGEKDRRRRDELAAEYARVSALHIHEVLSVTGGRAFCLFTSRQAMGLTMAAMGHMPWPHICQGEMSKGETLDWFRSTPGAVLFAVASFWEGCDVPGEALSCVIIDRIPFPPPSDLLHQARCDALGKDWFRRLNLPYATTKLKQGVGRLIRSETDRGLLVLLDPRFRTRPYGQEILAALPPARRIRRGELKAVPWFLAGAGEPRPPCTPAEEWAAGALRTLAGLDPDRAASRNHEGFSASDSAIGHRLAERLPLLTPGLWRRALEMLRRYGRQIGECS